MSARVNKPTIPLKAGPGGFKRLLGGWRSRIEEFPDCEANVAGDLTQKSRRDVSALMYGNCGDATIGVPELLVRTALADFPKTQPLQTCHDLTRLEDRWLGHESRHNGLDADEFSL
jgi:hypothetical protein